MHPVITVTAAIIEKNGLILAARKKRGLHLEGQWEFPGGKLEDGEEPKACLERELKEELGISSKVGELLAESVFSYPEKRIRLLGFLTSHTGGNFHLSDHDQLRWLPPHELATLNWAPADRPLVEAIISRRLTEPTLAYYDNYANEYVSRTIGNDMSEIREGFLNALPREGHILDLGCGSGRDSRAFLDRGHTVMAVDGSATIAALAADYLQQQVAVVAVQDLDLTCEFDGIWACAVLLHLPRSQFVTTVEKLLGALCAGGILYISLKRGQGEIWDERGRFIRYYTEDELIDLLSPLIQRDSMKITTSENRSAAGGETWLNLTIRK